MLTEVNANWDQATTQQTVANLLPSFPKIDGVYSQGGAMILGENVAKAVEMVPPVVTDTTLAKFVQTDMPDSLWLATQPRLLLLDDPTRGVDISARSDIYHHIRGLAAQGVGVLINSTDTLELVGLCDRVLVMFEGRIVSELDRAGTIPISRPGWPSGRRRPRADRPAGYHRPGPVPSCRRPGRPRGAP